MSPDSSASLDALCEQLARATAARKVLVCAPDGSVLSHAGDRGLLAGSTAVALAELASEMLVFQLPEVRDQTVPPLEDHFAWVGALQVCAALLSDRALLLVLFDERAAIGQVRLRVRRARSHLLRALSASSTNGAPAAS